MRVLHVIAGNLFGGIETLLVTLARQRALCPAMEPEFAVCFEGRVSAELRAAGAEVHVLGPARVSRPWTIWRVRRGLRALLDAGGYVVVVTHGCWSHAIAGPVVRRCQLRLVFYGHGFQGGGHWLERWARWTPPDRIIANSRATAATMPALFADVPTAVVYYPVSPPALLAREQDREQDRREVRQALATQEDTVVIVQVSRMEEWKGHKLLLEALTRLKTMSGWKCWIVGGPQRPEEESYHASLQSLALARGLGERVRFLGQRADVPRLLAAADIHCQPNTGPEPFGITFVEALYAGLPVVTTALGGALEIVEESCGRLVPPGDADVLADALRQCISDRELRQRLGSAGPARASRLCSPEQSLADVHRQLLDVTRA